MTKDVIGPEIIIIIDGKETQHQTICKATIIINLITDIIRNLSNKIHQTMHFIIIIITIDNYHLHQMIQDSKLTLIIAVFLLTTWDDCRRTIPRRKSEHA